MTLKIIDKAYAKKIERLKKRSNKYKQRTKFFMNVIVEQNLKIDNMSSLNEEIVQNFEQNQRKLIAANDKAEKDADAIPFKFTIFIMMWMCMFVSFIRIVHSSKGLTDDSVDIIYGSMVLTSIAVFSGYCVMTKLLN